MLCCFATLATAQQLTIEGITTDASDNRALPFVNIGITNTDIGTISSSDGSFKIKLAENQDRDAFLTFSYIGYATQRHKVS